MRAQISKWNKEGGIFLIKKERKKPFKLQMEEVLAKRLSPTHQNRPKILENMKKALVGYQGETNLDYHLSFLSEKEYIIFQDLRLRNEKGAFQLDTLILCSSFALIIESKNFYGTLFFDIPSRQLIRTYDNKEEGFSDPIMQAERQKKKFEIWIQNHNLKSFPIESLIAIGSTSTILKTNAGQDHIFQKVLHAEHVPNKILELVKRYEKHSLSSYMLNKLSDLLLEENTPLVPNILDVYLINKAEIITGVQCPFCNKIPIARKHGTWICTHCHKKEKHAHIQAIHDYVLLNHSITNEECCRFLHINSPQLATRLLSEANLPYTGSRKGRVYHLKNKGLTKRQSPHLYFHASCNDRMDTSACTVTSSPDAGNILTDACVHISIISRSIPEEFRRCRL
jgi:hypothetical protein